MKMQIILLNYWPLLKCFYLWLTKKTRVFVSVKWYIFIPLSIEVLSMEFLQLTHYTWFFWSSHLKFSYIIVKTKRELISTLCWFGCIYFFYKHFLYQRKKKKNTPKKAQNYPHPANYLKKPTKKSFIGKVLCWKIHLNFRFRSNE